MDFLLPELGEGIYEAEMIRWMIKPGDTIVRGQSLLEVMTDKATMEVPSPFAGTITKLLAVPGSKVRVGEPILGFDGEAARTDSSASAKLEITSLPAKSGNLSNNGPSTVVLSTPATVVAAPSVRHFARKVGIDLTQVRGSGPAGRILLDDLVPYVNRGSDDKARKPTKELPREDFGKPGTRIKLAGLRRKIAEHLVEAKRKIPHYAYIDECNVTAMVQLRQSLREPCAERGIKLTYLSFFVKAVAMALKQIPIVNSSLEDEKGEIVLHDKYNVGIAVATPGGLIVPVIQNADRKDLFTIAADVERLGNDAKLGKARLEDLRGGTFTVTSVGNIGGLISTPIVNHPEAGIMGVGKVVKRPIYNEAGEIVPAEIVYLSFSFDHRIVDGAVGAAFGNAVKKHLENPAAMLLPPVK